MVTRRINNVYSWSEWIECRTSKGLSEVIFYRLLIDDNFFIIFCPKGMYFFDFVSTLDAYVRVFIVLVFCTKGVIFIGDFSSTRQEKKKIREVATLEHGVICRII